MRGSGSVLPASQVRVRPICSGRARHRRYAGHRRGHRPWVPPLRCPRAGLRADRAAGLPSAAGRTASYAGGYPGPGAGGRAVRKAIDLFGRLDVVVSNAGGSPYAAAATASPRFHAKVIELNLVAPLHIAQAANAVMQGQGRRVDHHGRQRQRQPAVAGHGRLRRGQGRPAPPGHQPRDRVGARGQDQLRRARLRGHRGGRRAVRRPAAVAAVAATVPLRRMATPDDVAQACLFLASPGAAYVSGTCLTVHGGGEPPAFSGAGVGSR